MAQDVDAIVRSSALAWIREKTADGVYTIERPDLLTFRVGDQRIPLVDQRGIRKPAMLDAALTITTTYTPPGRRPPYDDDKGPDGLLRYKYRGTDPNQADNRGLRRAMEQQLPLIWFFGVAPGVYQALAPVWLVGEEPAQHQFIVAVDEAQRLVEPGRTLDEDRRQYVERLTRQRVHQAVFRAQVLRAYDGACAMCRLRHVELLDAAHILPDTHPRGLPVVPNGLSLCKIHHGAYDANIVGIRPDLVVEVRDDILREIDGPMLRYGLQQMAGTRLEVPRSRYKRPDHDALEVRYDEFRRSA